MNNRLQPDRYIPENPDAEDEGYERARQRELDEEMVQQALRRESEDRAVADAMKWLGISDKTAEDTLRTLYRFGFMDGAMRAAREVLA